MASIYLHGSPALISWCSHWFVENDHHGKSLMSRQSMYFFYLKDRLNNRYTWKGGLHTETRPRGNRSELIRHTWKLHIKLHIKMQLILSLPPVGWFNMKYKCNLSGSVECSKDRLATVSFQWNTASRNTLLILKQCQECSMHILATGKRC